VVLVLQPPDTAVIARRDLVAALAARGKEAGPWFTEDLPAERPTDERFVVVETLDIRQDDPFSADMMTQFRIYDPDPRRCKDTAKLINALIPTLPAGFEIQDTDHIGGPTEQADPRVPGARRYLVTWWLTAMCEPV
jgi:hypothetical protein